MRRFPVMGSKVITGIPWEMLTWQHNSQAILNHSQTLARLAERGGLSVPELLAVLDGKSLNVLMDEMRALGVREYQRRCEAELAARIALWVHS